MKRQAPEYERLPRLGIPTVNMLDFSPELNKKKTNMFITSYSWFPDCGLSIMSNSWLWHCHNRPLMIDCINKNYKSKHILISLS